MSLSDFQVTTLRTTYENFLRKGKNLDFIKEMEDLERKYNRDKKPTPPRRETSKRRERTPQKRREKEEVVLPRKRQVKEQGEVVLPYRAHLYLPCKMDANAIKAWLKKIGCNKGDLIQIELFKKTEKNRANLFIEHREDYDTIMRSTGIDGIRTFEYDENKK